MKAKYKYPKKRISMRDKIILSAVTRMKNNKGCKISSPVRFAIATMIAYDIVPKISNNYRRRQK